MAHPPRHTPHPTLLPQSHLLTLLQYEQRSPLTALWLMRWLLLSSTRGPRYVRQSKSGRVTKTRCCKYVVSCCVVVLPVECCAWTRIRNLKSWFFLKCHCNFDSSSVFFRFFLFFSICPSFGFSQPLFVRNCGISICCFVCLCICVSYCCAPIVIVVDCK